MAASFRQLFRHSKFAAFDPARKGAVFASVKPPSTLNSGDTSAASKIHGKDFALKREIPNLSESDCVTIGDLDTPYGFSRVQDASALAIRQAVYQENFALTPDDIDSNADSSVSSPAAAETKTKLAAQPDRPNLYTMSDDQFTKLLDRAKTMRQQYHSQVERFPTRKGSLVYAAQLLDVNTDGEMEESYPCSFGYLSSKMQRLKDHKIRGRILNRVPGGFAVGIGGAVGFLPQLTAEEFAEYAFSPDNRLRTYDFYLQDLRWSREGKPHIVVSMRPLSDTAGLDANEGPSSADTAKEDLTPDGGAHSELQSLLDEILNAATKPVEDVGERPARLSRRKRATPAPVAESSNADLQNSLADFLNSLDKK